MVDHTRYARGNEMEKEWQRKLWSKITYNDSFSYALTRIRKAISNVQPVTCTTTKHTQTIENEMSTTCCRYGIDANLLPSSDIFHTSETYFLHFTHLIRLERKCTRCKLKLHIVSWLQSKFGRVMVIFNGVCSVSHQLFPSHSLHLPLPLSLCPPVAFHSFTLELSSLISVFLITHNNKLSVTLSWQKSLLWIAKMNRMKNDGPFAGLEEQSVGHHEGDWKEWKEITFGYTIIYLYHFMFIPFSSTAFFAVPVQQMAAFSIHTDPNWQWHLKSMRIKSVPCWNAILSHAMYSEQYNQEKFNVSPFAEAGKKWIWLQKTFRLAEQAIIARNIQTNKVNRIQFVSDTKIRKSC